MTTFMATLLSVVFVGFANVACVSAAADRTASLPNTTYYIDPSKGDDANAGAKADAPWKSLANVNALHLSKGCRVELRPGRSDVSLHVMGEGTVEQPIVIRLGVRMDLVICEASAHLNSKPIRWPPRKISRSSSAAACAAQK